MSSNDIRKVGSRLVELCRSGRFLEAVEELYDDAVVSEEATAGPGWEKRLEGKEAVVEKGRWWMEHHEVHEAEVVGPFPHGERFAVLFRMEVTPRGGERMKGEEIALYTVKGGKVVKEEFFYSPME